MVIIKCSISAAPKIGSFPLKNEHSRTSCSALYFPLLFCHTNKVVGTLVGYYTRLIIWGYEGGVARMRMGRFDWLKVCRWVKVGSVSGLVKF